MEIYSLNNALKSSLLCFFLIGQSSFAATKIILNNQELPSIFNSGLDTGYYLKNFKEITLPNGKVKYKYQQYFKNIPVWDSHLVKESNNNFFGSLVVNIENDISKVEPILSKDNIIKIIKEKFNNFNDNNANLNIELYIKNINQTAKLIYKTDFLITEPKLSRPNLVIDANSGEILEQWDGLTSVKPKEITGPGGNEKTGKYQYGKDYGFIPGSTLKDKCQMRSPNVVTYDNNHTYSTTTPENSKPFSFDCSENTYKEINGGYAPINDAHYFGNIVFQMYKDWFKIKPIKSKLKLLVHYGKKVDNAYWTGDAMLFGDGYRIFYPVVSLDALAHEVSHGFTEQNSGLIYSDTHSGGINESFSDIAGEAAKYYMNKDKTEGEKNDWMLGSKIFKGNNDEALRYFKDPKKDGKSIDNANDFTRPLDPHYGSGVFNKAFYNLATTKDWDVPKAFKTFVTANQVYWTAKTTFDEAGCGVFKAAKDLEQNTDDVIAAFKDVGVNAVCEKAPDPAPEENQD